MVVIFIGLGFVIANHDMHANLSVIITASFHLFCQPPFQKNLSSVLHPLLTVVDGMWPKILMMDVMCFAGRKGET